MRMTQRAASHTDGLPPEEEKRMGEGEEVEEEEEEKVMEIIEEWEDEGICKETGAEEQN